MSLGAKTVISPIASLPRVRLAHLPTPLEPLDRLRAGVGPRLWVKRDDATGLAGGGNKARKLEYLLGAALAEAVDTVLTAGAAQSNHARQTAAACARLGLACELLVDVPVPGAGPEYEQSGNALIDRLLGARVRVVETSAGYAVSNGELERALEERADELRRDGRRPYLIPLGGSNGLGAVAYVETARELAMQCILQGFVPDVVVVATSSGATQVGLASGFAALGMETRTVGMVVAGDGDLARSRAASVLAELALLGLPVVDAGDLELDGSQAGPGYGVPSEACLAAIREAAEREGLLLDPVYTGKAMAGLLERVRRGDLAAADNVVFVHTGGWPALFGYRQFLTAAPARATH